MEAESIQPHSSTATDLQKPVAKTLWELDPEITFLNHGSFGACPLPVLAFQQELRRRMEARPVQFLARDLEDLKSSVETLALR